jgi:small subunit ribosomal protein S20
MPITKQASKKLRHDRVVTKQNTITRHLLESKVKKARKSPKAATLAKAFAAVDKASKHHLIHKNTAARLKSRLAKLLKK